VALDRFTLYWSSLEVYEKCAQHFLWRRGWPGIDLGRGPGKGKARPKRSRHHAIMGIAIQHALEQMYNEEWWKTPLTLRDRLRQEAKRKFREELMESYIDWMRAPSQVEMEDLVLNGVEGYLDTMKHNRLLGISQRSELDMHAYVNKWTPIGGQADFIIRRDREPREGVTILDGKNSKHKGKYTNPDQLRWYALCFYLAFGTMPTALGFVYFRYPYGSPEVNEKGIETGEINSGVDWIPFTKEDLSGLAERAIEARKAMGRHEFDANPVPKECRLCDWEDECPERQAQRAANAAKRNPRKGLPILKDAEGFMDFGFGDGGKK